MLPTIDLRHKVAYSSWYMEHHTVITDAIKKRGGKITLTRKAIIELLSREHGPFSAQDLLAHLATKRLHVNKTTVYREIEFLLKEEVIQMIQLGERKKRYELKSDNHHHHLVCTNCNSIDDIELDEGGLHPHEKAIKAKKRFKVTRHALEFYGLCLNCQKN